MERILPNDMKSSHFGVINRLVRLEKKENPTDLACAFQVTRPSMTNTLQKLAAKGYITIESDLLDGRENWSPHINKLLPR